MAKIREETREGALLVSKYRLEKLLGAGGMGEVYRAQNELIGRAVAIKVLRPEYSRNADVVQRFLREARAANMVRHANVVDVLDVGTDETGAPFIVQELLEGGDLATYIDRCGGKLGLRETLEVMRPVVEAVALAHSKGVVHRDLKPSNVFLDERAGATVPKVLDFGISKIATPAGEARMTATGAAMGTPAYMSPEQIQGSSQVDARTDVWALGVMLYELLSGRLPFEAPTSGGLFVKICTVDPTPFAQVAPDAPAVVGRVIERCLSRDPDGRYADASELAAALKQAQSTLPPPAHVARGSGSDPGIAKPRAELAATLEATGELVTGPTLAPAVRECTTR